MRRQFTVLAALLALSSIFCLGGPALAGSPVGVWDVTVSGLVNGVGYLEFTSGGDVFGFAVVIPNPKKKDVVETVLGFAVFTGTWDLNSSGKVIGFLQSPADSDVRLDVDSFKGTAKSDKLSLSGETENGNIAFTGVGAVDVDSIVGPWSAAVTRIKDKVKKKSVQFFDLIAADCTDPLIGGPFFSGPCNVFEIVDGTGADTCVVGVALLSGNGKMGVVTREIEAPDPPDTCADLTGEEEGLLSAVIGKLKSGKATLTGNEEGDTATKVNMVLTQE